MKLCSRCNLPKHKSEFGKDPKTRDGLRHWCKQCCNETNKEWQKSNPKKHAAQMARWRKANPEKSKATLKKYASSLKGKESQRRAVIKRRYGITLEQYNQLFLKQNGCCGSCGRPDNGNGGNLCVDHNHITGKIRGLLCHFCNMALGNLFGDEKGSELICNLAAYVENGKRSIDADS